MCMMVVIKSKLHGFQKYFWKHMSFSFIFISWYDDCVLLHSRSEAALQTPKSSLASELEQFMYLAMPGGYTVDSNLHMYILAKLPLRNTLQALQSPWHRRSP